MKTIKYFLLISKRANNPSMVDRSKIDFKNFDNEKFDKILIIKVIGAQFQCQTK